MTTMLATRDLILDRAEELVRSLGYDGFSYADVAERVGVRKASIHHHFPTKADLGVALVARFRAECSGRLAAVGGDPAARVGAFVGLFRDSMAAGRMCLCGVLAAGFAGRPGPVRSAVLGAIGEMETWLARAIDEGRASERFRPGGSAEGDARLILGGLEGALLLAIVRGDPGRFDESADRLVRATLGPIGE